MSRPAHRLQRRLMLAFAGFVLLASGVFGFYAIAFMYSVEDAFFDTTLEQEAAAQLLQFAQHGHWSVPRDASITLHRDATSFPPELRALQASEPSRHEFPGREGRHYHLRAVEPPAPAEPVWLVAEVGSQLVVRPMRDRVFLLLAGSGLVLVVLALLFGYWLARRTAGPLSRLATLVDGMSPGRLPSGFSRDFGDDDVGILARGLEGLAERVQAFIAREQSFTRDASHELRTPLAVIRSAAERLVHEPGLSDAGRQHLGHVRQSALQLDHTVTTLLSLAREDGAAIAAEPVRLVPLIERVIVEQSPLLEGKDVTVGMEVAHAARLTLPEPVLHILLSNLVGNAFAHTASGAVRIDIDQGRLRIANSGDGGDPERRWRLQQPVGKREGSEGFGLGLAIVRRLCDRYGIDLRIEGVEGGAVASLAIDPVADRAAVD